MPQTSYGFNMAPAFAGMIADNSVRTVHTYANGATPIAFGLGVAQGATADDCKLPGAAGDKFIGVALHEHVAKTDAGVAQHVPYSAVPVMSRGPVWVWTEQAVGPTDPVFVRHTANGAGTAPGQFRKDIDTDKAIAVAGARFLTSTTGAGLVKLELNLPA